MSISSTDSCGSPLRNDVDSMPRPVTAPPRVIVLSCGTTYGIKPTRQGLGDQVLVGAHALHVGGQRIDVDLDDAVEPADVETRESDASRGRNRLEVFLARRTRSPAGMRTKDSPSRSTAS